MIETMRQVVHQWWALIQFGVAMVVGCSIGITLVRDWYSASRTPRLHR